jgi:hypothetical protein
MRTVIFLLLLLPVIANAQFKRSATELAKDRIKEYVTQKLFKDLSYQPGSFGQLTDSKSKDPEVTCFIRHKFLITEIQSHEDLKTPVQKEYQFVFYFDERMKVTAAESVSSE